MEPITSFKKKKNYEILLLSAIFNWDELVENEYEIKKKVCGCVTERDAFMVALKNNT